MTNLLSSEKSTHVNEPKYDAKQSTSLKEMLKYL